MFHSHTQPFVQSADQEFQEIADNGREGNETKPRVCPQINNAVDETTDGANLPQEWAEVATIACEQGSDEHVRHLGGKTADDSSLLNVSRNRFSFPLGNDCLIQLVQFLNHQRISVIADVLFQNLSYQTEA